MKSTRTQRKLRLGATAALSASILALAGCGQIYPSTEPANGPANGIKSSLNAFIFKRGAAKHWHYAQINRCFTNSFMHFVFGDGGRVIKKFFHQVVIIFSYSFY